MLVRRRCYEGGEKEVQRIDFVGAHGGGIGIQGLLKVLHALKRPKKGSEEGVGGEDVDSIHGFLQL